MTETSPPDPSERPRTGQGPPPPPAAPPPSAPTPGYGAPPGYGVPPGAPPSGYGPPPGYGPSPGAPPPAYGQPPGYPPPPPGYPPPGYGPSPGYGAPPGYMPYGTAPIKAGPAPGLAYAGFWIRFLAILIDSVILSVVQILPIAAAGNAGPALSLFVSIAYFIGFWGLTSQTPGMMALRLRIVRVEDGGPLDLGRAAIRYVGYILSLIVLFLGLIWAGFAPRKQ